MINATMLRLILLALAIGPAAAQNFQPDSATAIASVIWPSNTNAVQICLSASGECGLYGINAANNGGTAVYIKLYNSANPVTCGSGTPQWRGMILPTSQISVPNMNGDVYTLGIWACVTGAITDADTTAVPSNTVSLTIRFKVAGKNIAAPLPVALAGCNGTMDFSSGCTMGMLP
jgi:hypothetical protein